MITCHPFISALDGWDKCNAHFLASFLQFRSGAAVQARLARPFFVELQSRYGNLFFVREEVRAGLGPTVNASAGLRG